MADVEEYRYRMNQAPRPANDGSGVVKHDMKMTGLPEGGEEEDVFELPSHHKDFCIPADEITPVMDMPDSTGTERQAKNSAYKDLLEIHVDTMPIPTVWPPGSDWTPEGADAYLDAHLIAQAEFDAANTLAATEAARVTDYVENVLNQEWPIEFKLDWVQP